MAKRDAPRTESSATGRRVLHRWGLLLLWFCIFFGICAAGRVGFKTIRRQHALLIMLRNQLEHVAAPGEQVMVEDHALWMVLSRVASPALRQELVLESSAEQQMAGTNGCSEKLLLARPSGAAVRRLRATGLRVSEQTEDAHWEKAGGGLMGFADVRVFFVAGVAGCDAVSSH